MHPSMSAKDAALESPGRLWGATRLNSRYVDGPSGTPLLGLGPGSVQYRLPAEGALMNCWTG
jgi:hypothetical protein